MTTKVEMKSQGYHKLNATELHISIAERKWEVCSLEELAINIGVPTFVFLAQACQFVPQPFLHKQVELITNICRAGSTKFQLLSAEKISATIKTIDSNGGFFVGTPPASIL